MKNPFKKIAETFLTAYATDQGDTGGDGLQGQIQKVLLPLWSKIKIWLVITIIMFIIYYILLIGSCSRPSTGNGTCIQKEEQGLNNSFEIDLSTITTGGACSDDIYNVGGQTIDWIDTGFETTGKPLVVYASGNYFPWGKQQTAKTFGYHTTITKLNDGTFAETLAIKDDYVECGLNTILRYLGTDDQGTIAAYQNQLNAYTLWNANNRLSQISGSLFNKENEHVMADCVIGGNCKVGSEKEDPTSCVLKNGAGIYMRIGNESEFAYHIINHQIPKLKKTCVTAEDCKYSYVTSGNSKVLQTIPFGLPTLVYNYEGSSSKNFIHDIRDSIQRDIIPITDYQHETEYEFSILQLRDDQESTCTGLKEQLISGYCYQSVTKKLTLQEMQNPTCPPDGKTEITLPNELCAPQKGKRIWIKPADTCYEDNDGNIKLTFAGGAENKNPKFHFENHGFKLSWIQNILQKALTPFWGDQGDTDAIKDYTSIQYLQQTKQIKICRTDIAGEIVLDDLHFSKRGDNYAIKLNKFDLSGMLIKNDSIAPTKVSKIAYADDTGKLKNCVVITLSDYIKTTTSDGTLSEIPVKTTINDFYPEYANQAATLLFKYNDMEHGLFVQVRNAIMSSGVYHTFRIMVVVWFVFSFGIGFVNKQKAIAIKTLSMDWKRFLILMWVSDPGNYELIDNLLWPWLFKMVEGVSSGIFDAASGVWGTSLQYDNPLDFFDDIIEGVTSKELLYRLGAIATTPSIFYTFFVIFPFVASYCIDLIIFVVGPVLCLCISLFDLGQIIMLMPIYALVSLSNISKNSFKKAINGLVNDFVHMAFAIGFFGMFCGFIYYSFAKLMYFQICWEDTFSINFFGVWKHTWGDWMLPGDFKEKIECCWNIIKNIFGATILTGTLGKMLVPTLVEELANIFAKAANSNFGFMKANVLSQSAGQYVQDLINEQYKAMQDAKKEEEKAGKGDKGTLDDENEPMPQPPNYPPLPNTQPPTPHNDGIIVRQNETNNPPPEKNQDNKNKPEEPKKQEEGENVPQQQPEEPKKQEEGENVPQPQPEEPKKQEEEVEERIENKIITQTTIINRKIIKKKKPSRKEFTLDDNAGSKQGDSDVENAKNKSLLDTLNNPIIKKKKPSRKEFTLDDENNVNKKSDVEEVEQRSGAMIADSFENAGIKENDAGIKENDAGIKDGLQQAGIKDGLNETPNDKNNEADIEKIKKEQEEREKQESKMKQKQIEIATQLAAQEAEKKKLQEQLEAARKKQKELERERLRYEQMAKSIDLNKLMSKVNHTQTTSDLQTAKQLSLQKQKVLQVMQNQNLSYQQKIDAKIEILRMLDKANSGKLKMAKQNSYFSTKKKKW